MAGSPDCASRSSRLTRAQVLRAVAFLGLQRSTFLLFEAPRPQSTVPNLCAGYHLQGRQELPELPAWC